MMNLLKRFLKNESGAAAIEYGLIASLIVVGSFLALNSVSLNLKLVQTFTSVANGLH